MNAPRAPVAPTRLVLLGHPVSHSRSPAMQGAALRAAGLSVGYEAMDVPAEGLASALAGLRRDRAGGNVTIPHKEAVAAAATRLTDAARRVGAVNTFWHDGEALVGHNTDLDGARAALDALWSAPLDGRPAVVLGAGGSAAAVLVALAERPHGGIQVVARSPARAAQVAHRVGVPVEVVAADAGAGSAAGAMAAIVREAGVLVNATPIGQHGPDEPVPAAWLVSGQAVLDLVYAPGGTAWVRGARAAGCAAEDGMRMLVEQGAHAFTAWFGLVPDRGVMWQAATRR